MLLGEFLEQDRYCRENNIPEGKGCDNCPAIDKEYCADALRRLCNQWQIYRRSETKTQFEQCVSELENVYGLSMWNQLALTQGIIEFPS